MKVVQVTADLVARSGGPPRFVVEACASVMTHGIESTIVTTNLGAPSNRWRQDRVGLSGLIEGSGLLDVRMYPAVVPTGAFAPTMLQGLKRVVRTADLVHIHSLYLFPEWAAYRAARAAGKPYVVSAHGALDPFIRRRHPLAKGAINAAWQSRMLKGAAALHFTTEAEACLAADVAPDVPRMIVPVGVRTSVFEQLPAEGGFRERWTPNHRGPLIVNIGRLSFKKGLDVLIRAAAQLRQGGHDVMVAFVGPDDEGLSAMLREVARDVGMDEHVVFTGLLQGSEKLQALADATVWALPSHSENFGIAVVEALAAGVPVVVSDKVNLADAIAAAGAGQVAGVRAEEFRDAIARVLDGGPAIIGAIERGRAFAKTYDWETVGGDLADAYAKVVLGASRADGPGAKAPVVQGGRQQWA